LILSQVCEQFKVEAKQLIYGEKRRIEVDAPVFKSINNVEK